MLQLRSALLKPFGVFRAQFHFHGRAKVLCHISGLKLFRHKGSFLSRLASAPFLPVQYWTRHTTCWLGVMDLEGMTVTQEQLVQGPRFVGTSRSESGT